MGDASERLTEAERLLPELDEITIAISDTEESAILGLRRKDGNQVELFRTTLEGLRNVCRGFLEKADASFPDPTVAELQEIRKKLSEIAKDVPLSGEIVAQLGFFLETTYDLPKRRGK